MVHKHDEKLCFDEAPNGLHFHDVTNQQISSPQMVDENKKKCTERQVACAEEAHAVHTKIGCPSPADHQNFIQELFST